MQVSCCGRVHGASPPCHQLVRVMCWTSWCCFLATRELLRAVHPSKLAHRRLLLLACKRIARVLCHDAGSDTRLPPPASGWAVRMVSSTSALFRAKCQIQRSWQSQVSAVHHPCLGGRRRPCGDNVGELVRTPEARHSEGAVREQVSTCFSSRYLLDVHS